MALDTAVMGMICKQLINIHSDIFLIAASFSPSCLGLVKMCPNWRVSVGCLEDVWGVSGAVCVTLDTFWGCYNTKSIDTNPIGVILTSCTLSSQWPFLGVFEPKIPNFRSDVEG